MGSQLDINLEWFSTIVEELKRVSKRSKNRQYFLLVPVQEYFTRVVSQIGQKISILEILNEIDSVTNFIFEAVCIITYLREANYEDLDLTDLVPNFIRNLETLVPHLIRSTKNSACLNEYTNSLLYCFLKIVTVKYNSWFYSTIIDTSCLTIMWICKKYLSQSMKKQLSEVVLSYMDGLLQALSNCGDYGCQNFILDIILNLVKLQQIGQQRRAISQLFPNLNPKEQSNLLNDDSPNYGTLLNELNFLARLDKTILSVEIFNLFIGKRNFQKHSEINKHWINFSHRSKRMHFKADIDLDSGIKQFDVNIELAQIESVCISKFPEQSLSGNFYVLHIHLKSDIASISNKLLSHTETNCRSVHVVFEDFDAVNEAIEKMGYTLHDFDSDNELCCYPQLLWLWSSVYKMSLLDKSKDKGPSEETTLQYSEQNECIEDETLESYQNEESENMSPVLRCDRNKRSSNFNMKNCHKENEESEKLSPLVRCDRNKRSSNFNMENCHKESVESENLSPLVRCDRNKRSSNFNMENCHKENKESEKLSPLVHYVGNKRSFNFNIENCQKESEESENLSPPVRWDPNKRSSNFNLKNCQKESDESRNLSPLVRCVRNKRRFNCNLENCQEESEESENLSPPVRWDPNKRSSNFNMENCRKESDESRNSSPLVRCVRNKRRFNCNMENCQEESEESRNLSPLVRCVQNEGSFGLNMENCRNESEESENFSPRVRSLDSCRSKENEFPMNLIPHALFQQGIIADTSSESQEIYPATPNTSVLYQPYLPEDRLKASDEQAVRLILTSTTAESCLEDPFPRSIRRNIMEEVELTIPTSSSEYDQLSLSFEKDVKLFIHPPEVPVPCIRIPEESEHYIHPPEVPVPCIRTPEESGHYIRTSEKPRSYIRTPYKSGPCIRTPEKSGPCIRTPENSGSCIRTPEKSGPCIRTPEKSGPYVRTPEKSGSCIHTPEESGPCSRTPEKPGPCIRTPEESVPCIRTPEKSGPCIRTPEKSGPYVRTPEKSGSCIHTPEESGPCIRTPEESVLCIRTPEKSGLCIRTPEKSGPCIRTPEKPGSCIRPPEELDEHIYSGAHRNNVGQTVSKVQNRIPCYMKNKENLCTLSQGTDPYIPRCVRELNIKQVVKPKRSRPVPSKMKTFCRPLPVRKVSTKTEKKKNVERLRKKIIRLENKLHKFQSGMDQLELELVVAREELLEEERAAGDA